VAESEHRLWGREILLAMSSENIEVIRSLTERINAGDTEGVMELIHPDLELFPPDDEPEAKAVYRGREGYREYSSYWSDTFDQWQTEVDEYIDAGEYVMVVARSMRGGAPAVPKSRTLASGSGEFATAWPSNAASIGQGKSPLEAAGLSE
jgi:ketosteroid isomerase-like protein